MLITCPNCKKTSSVTLSGGAAAVKVRCSDCRAVFRVVRKDSPPVPAAGGRIRVVVANESPSFCEAVQKLLASDPIDLALCHDGADALATVKELRPQVLLLDVALPGMLGFEVCEQVRQDPALAAVKIILIASIYDKTRYKRSPSSLYGADDYIEKHHIPDSLLPMIYRLVGQTPEEMSIPSVQELAAQDRARLELRQFEVRETSLPPRVEVPEAEQKARRLARIIVSDIALYNQGKVEQGIREGNFYTLLADDIREGELLYQQRVPEGVRASTSYLREAFEALIEQKKRDLLDGLG